jgi:hypothetical protein
MADLLDRGADWLETQRTRHLTREVAYVRGADQVTVLATIGRTRFETDDGEVVQVRYTDRDFLVLAEHLILDGQPTLPARGDTIRETIGAVTQVFEVFDWRYSDPYQRTLRISTKFLGSLEA